MARPSLSGLSRAPFGRLKLTSRKAEAFARTSGSLAVAAAKAISRRWRSGQAAPAISAA